MQKIFERKLNNGMMLEIVRIISPDECRGKLQPDWVLSFFQHNLPKCWQLYYEDIFAGKVQGVRDYMYAGLADGVPCSRMWFGYSERNGSGNFGNVETLPEYRRRGIMRDLLNQCVSDIRKSGAVFCSCDAAPTAAPAYASAGFQRIFPEGQPPMVFVQPRAGAFSDIVKKAYSSTGNAKIRQGTLSDRFDCDKLLMYAPEVYGKVIPRKDIPMYLSLWQEYVCTGKTRVAVLETETGFCSGYAAWIDGEPYCILHPHFVAYKNDLTETARTIFSSEK